MPLSSNAIEPASHTRDGLDQAFGALARAGGWFDARQRVAIAEQARAARRCGLCADRKAALTPNAVEGRHDAPTGSLASEQTSEKAPEKAPGPPPDRSGALPTPLIDAVHRIRSDPGRLTRSWFDALVAEGVRPEELVEATSIVSFVTIDDTLARALGQPERSLPRPQPGEPHRQPATGTTLARAWVPTVEPDAAEGLTKAMYETVRAGAGFVFNVARALTCVPEALRDFFCAFLPNYATHGPVRPGGLDRTQVELLAATTSSYNDCFY